MSSVADLREGLTGRESLRPKRISAGLPATSAGPPTSAAPQGGRCTHGCCVAGGVTGGIWRTDATTFLSSSTGANFSTRCRTLSALLKERRAAARRRRGGAVSARGGGSDRQAHHITGRRFTSTSSARSRVAFRRSVLRLLALLVQKYKY